VNTLESSLFKQAPLSILKHISIKKAIMEQLPSVHDPDEEREGFF
jgi:hypothetical protein